MTKKFRVQVRQIMESRNRNVPIVCSIPIIFFFSSFFWFLLSPIFLSLSVRFRFSRRDLRSPKRPENWKCFLRISSFRLPLKILVFRYFSWCNFSYTPSLPIMRMTPLSQPSRAWFFMLRTLSMYICIVSLYKFSTYSAFVSFYSER